MFVLTMLGHAMRNWSHGTRQHAHAPYLVLYSLTAQRQFSVHIGVVRSNTWLHHAGKATLLQHVPILLEAPALASIVSTMLHATE